MDSASMTATARALADAGFRVARFEFAYMASRRSAARWPATRMPAKPARAGSSVSAGSPTASRVSASAAPAAALAFMPKALIAWSSGKDSAWALHEARRAGVLEIAGALTTVTEEFARVSMHGVREELLHAQLSAARLASRTVRIPFPCPNEIYEARMAASMAAAKAGGITHVVFGDLFLEDIRAYRTAQLAKAGMTAIFPLWHRPTGALAREMIGAGMKAHIVCVGCSKPPARLAGRAFDESLLAELPGGVDPCGENGEFHTFVSAGPMFERGIPVDVGKTVERDGFAYADLLPS